MPEKQTAWRICLQMDEQTPGNLMKYHSTNKNQTQVGFARTEKQPHQGHPP
jgi:hypothetical protein